MSKRLRKIRKQNIIQLLTGVIIIVLLNIIGSYIFTRIDLTAEKRYTLSESTKDLLDDLEDVVYFQIYLDGDFPAGFKRLKNSTSELLDEFRAYNENIEYEFINPSESDDPMVRNSTYQLLMERGLIPTDLQVNTGDGMRKQIIFPGAIVTYLNNESPVELLRSQMGMPPEEVLNNSIESLEFNLGSAIKRITRVSKPKVAFITGHGELGELETTDIAAALAEYYILERVKIDGQVNSLTERKLYDSTSYSIRNKFDAIVIAQPDSVFSEKDKFIIDQFIMRGGKILWLIDPVRTSMDSLQSSDATVAVYNNLNLDDQLFNYGVRLNGNLIMDLNALRIPLTTGNVAGQPQIEFFPWYYFPVITPTSKHPVINNLNAIKTEFISSIDTIKTPGVKKEFLLWTSPYSKVSNVPVYINLNILREEPGREEYNMPSQPVAVLLEGNFKSLYDNRIPPSIMYSKEIDFIGKSEPTSMIVISDGDIIKNQLHYSKGYPLPLGYDQYTGQTFGNKELILNALNYLTDGPGLISIRSRELKLRLLDMTRVNDNKLFWQLFNVLLPIVVIIALGIFIIWFRKNKYTKPLVKK